ncbi:M48 family metallopeptidase [Streptomyces sp. NPDC003480]
MTRAPRAAVSGGPVGVQHPFRLPSGTSLRFALLVLSTSVAMSVALGQIARTAVYLLFQGGDSKSFDKMADCAAKNIALAGTDEAEFIRRCRVPASMAGDGAAVNIALIAALWLVVGVTYWLLPAYRLRRRRLRPFKPDAHPEIRRTLSDLIQITELPSSVRFVVDWRDQRLTGLAFGRIGRRYVLLSRGLLQLHGRDSQAFREIVLHELAHLRNRDVDIAFVTLICHRLFTYAIAAPMALFGPLAMLGSLVVKPSDAIFAVMLMGAQCGLAVTVACTSGAVLRSRELYADARAAMWTRGAPALRQLLVSQSAIEQTAPRRSLFRRMHPPAAKRLAALSDTALLFQFSAWEAFGLALSCSFVYLQVAWWTEDALGPVGYGVLGAAFAATTLGTSVGAGIWRLTVAAHLDRTTWVGAHRMGLAVGGGLALGACADEAHFTALAAGIADPISVQFCWWLLLGVVGYSFVRWNAVVARMWVPLVLVARRPLMPILASTAAGVVLLCVWLGSVYPVGTPGFSLLTLPRLLDPLPTPFDYVGYVFFMTIVLSPPLAVLAVVAATAALPLAAPFGVRVLRWARAGTGSPGPERFLLWPPSREVTAALISVRPQSPLRALIRGVVLGAAFGAGLWAVHVASAVAFPLPVKWLGINVPLYFALVPMTLQLAVGLLAARRAAYSELRALHGVLAALGAGIVVPFAALTSRDHFICLYWGSGQPACRWNPLANMSFEAVNVMAWAAAVTLLTLPASMAVADRIRQQWRARGRHSSVLSRPPLGM